MNTYQILEQTAQIVHAAKHVKAWGMYATRRYCEKRGIPLRLYYLARTLEAAKGL